MPSLPIPLTASDLRLVVAALLNVRQFVPEEEFESVMGFSKDEVGELCDRLWAISARSDL